MAEKYQSPKTRRQKWWYAFVLGILLLGAGLYYVQQQFQPPEGGDQSVAIDIPTGVAAYDVGVQLADKGLIRNPTAFKWYLAYQGKSGLLKAGKYYLKEGMNLEEIARVLVQGDAKYGTVKFTIPEGWTIEQIADSLDKQRLVEKKAFLNEVDSGQFDYAFVKDIPDKDKLKHRLEGYLAPDTYEVFKETTAHEVIDIMLKQTDAIFTPEWREQMKKQGLNVHQTLTMASLVEREAKVQKERPEIAGVLFNRLHANPPMMLQVDATVQFALGTNKEMLLYKDLEIDSPYNTYKFEGLPPGPIADPGRDAIHSVLFPDKHDYLFYVTKNDGSGEHYFSETFAGHEQNIAKVNAATHK